MLKGKNVLITGAAGGLGFAFAKEFAARGCNVIAHCRAPRKGFEESLSALASENNVSVTPLYFDLSDTAALKAALSGLIKAKTKVDVLVNNAGVPHGGLFQMTKTETIRAVFEINFFAQLEITRALLRWMSKNGGGSIINIASIAGLDLNAGNCAYGVSKAALIAFTKTLAAEYGSTKVRVNAVAPGLTDTNMAAFVEDNARAQMLSDTALKRLAKPGEIAAAVLFLASDEAGFVNGQVIRVDGGRC